jgi:hypothetical protein
MFNRNGNGNSDRRAFLQSGILGMAGLGLTAVSGTSVAIAETEKATLDPELTNDIDVLRAGPVRRR